MYLPTPPQALTNLKRPPVLTVPQITAKLAPVPGFILTNASGAPLTATNDTTKESGQVGVFLRRAGAQEFLGGLKQRDPQLAASLQIKAVSLGELWQRAQRPENKLSLVFIPDPAEVEKAKEILKQRGKPEVGSGVPLFLAELPDKRLLNMSQNGATFVPVFFSLADLIPVVERYNKARPAAAPEARVNITNLEFLLASWPKVSDKALKQMQLVVPKTVADEAKAVVGGT